MNWKRKLLPRLSTGAKTFFAAALLALLACGDSAPETSRSGRETSGIQSAGATRSGQAGDQSQNATWVRRSQGAESERSHPSAEGRRSRIGASREIPRDQVRRVRADDVVEAISASLEEGRLATAQVLRQTELRGVVDDILSIDGFQQHDLSSETLLREVYRRAEAGEAGQGERVLAYLYREAEAEFGAVRTDPQLAGIREIAAELPGQALDPATFRFGSAIEARSVRVSPVVDGAIGQLARVYSQGNLSQLRALAIRNFRRPGFSATTFEEIVSRSSNTRDALTRMFEAGTPPPSPERAAEALMRETLAENGTLRGDAEFLSRLGDLRSDLGLERLDPELRSYVANEDALPSRAHQLAQAERVARPGKVAKPGADAVLRTARRAQAAAWASDALATSAQQYTDYVGTSFDPPPDASSSGGGGGGGGGDPRRGGPGSAGPSSGGAPHAYDGGRPYRTASPPPSYRSSAGNVSRVPRTYRRAIRSARAARGVAAGGNVTSRTSAIPVRAAWMVNAEDGRFGRLVVEMRPSGGGDTYLAVSRTFFADSFYPATSLLWGGHYGNTAFREGEILVVVSMDPFANPDPNARREAERLLEDLQRRAGSIDTTNRGAVEAFMRDYRNLREASASLPRRVVVHPALFGRELAWSAIRVDFWFNDIAGLSREASQTNGGKTMPSALRDISLAQASTWQFFERDAEVRVAPRSSTVSRLGVSSDGPGDLQPHERGHFAVSMFRIEEDASEDAEPQRLRGLEQQLQPMLDWLSTNHHDFIRLNDFSESLSLLRWLRHNDVAPILVDMDGEAPPIATPDRMVIGEGPGVGQP